MKGNFTYCKDDKSFLNKKIFEFFNDDIIKNLNLAEQNQENVEIRLNQVIMNLHK